jgi:hypothetical protein
MKSEKKNHSGQAIKTAVSNNRLSDRPEIETQERRQATQKLKANNIANRPINKMLAIVQARSKTVFLPQ